MRLTILTFSILICSLTLSAQTVNPVLWKQKTGPTGGEISDIEFHSASGRTFAIAGTERHLYISVDDGDSWTDHTDTNSSFNFFNDISIVGTSIYLTTSFDVWLSVDAGDSWTQLSSNVSAFNNANRIIRLSTGRLVVLGNNGVHYSINNGTSWVSSPTMTGSINSRYLVKSAADQIFIVKDQKPFRSNDLGVNFAEFSTGLPLGYQIHSLWQDNNGNIYVVTGENIYSSNGSTSWVSIKGAAISDATISSFASSYPSMLEFSSDGIGMFFVDNLNHKLYAKTVAGAASTWELRQTSFPSTTTTVANASSRSFATAATSICLFGTEAGNIKTTNGGTTYSEANAFIAGIDTDAILFDITGSGSGNLLLLSSNRKTILKSTNGGDTWSKLSGIVGSVNSFVQNTSRNTVYVATGSGAYQSTNAGTNWTTVTVPGGVSQFVPLDADKVLSISGQTFYYSSNKGVSWSASPLVITGLPASFTVYEITAASATRIILRLYDFNTSSYKLFKIILAYAVPPAISSAVATEMTAFPASDVNKIFGANGNFYVYKTAGSPDQLKVSTDAGANWLSYDLSNNEDVFVTHNGYIFVPSYGPSRVLISRDNGASFQETSIDKQQLYRMEGVAIDYEGKAHLAFDSDFIYSTTKNIVLPDAQPSLLQEKGKSGTAVALAWTDNSTNENDFEIFQSTNGVDFVKSGEADDFCSTPNDRDFFVATGLQPNTAYTFRVRAVNDAGSTAPIQLSVTTLNSTSCTQTIPDNRSWSAVNTNTSGLGLVAAKIVNIKHISGGKYQVTDLSLGTLTGSPFNSSSDPATFFESCGQTFVVGSNDDDLKPDGNGTWNGVGTLTLKWRACEADEFETINLTLQASDPTPSAPTSVNAYSLTSSSIEVNWLAGNYDKTYVIERSTNSSSGFVQVGTTTYPTTKFIDNTGLVLGTTYYYRVKARNGNTPTPGESGYSSNATINFTNPRFVVPSNTVTNYVAATVGAYWADFNNDGFDDYMTLSFDPVTEKGTPVIFRNNGAGDFIITAPAGISGEAYFFATVADYDNDGFQDIAFAGQEDQLLDVYRGNGAFVFSKMSNELGDLNTVVSENIEIQTLSWGDINNDGLLDMVVAGEIPNAGASGTLLYKQNNDHTFTKWDAGELSEDIEYTSGIAWVDYNNDGYSDIFLINSSGPCRLYENNLNTTFSKKIGSNLNAANAFTASWGDYNNDGFQDLYVGTFSMNTLYKNNGNETFTQEGSTSVSESSQVISATWGDFNNDSFLDLLTGAFGTSVTRLFMRDASSPGSTIFTKVTNEKVNDLSTSHYGVSTADYDNNGALDIAMSSFTFGITNDEIGVVNTNLFRNNAASTNWSEVKLAPTSGNKSGVGATVKLTTGSVTQSRDIQSSASFVSKNPYTAHFGIGAATTISNIQVRWANGDVQNYPNPPKNQILIIDQDNVAPAISSISPTNNATNVSTNTTFSVTLDGESFAAAGMLLVYLHSNLSSPIFGINVTDAIKSGNTYTFTLPSNLLANTQYNISVDAGAFVDKYANGSAESPTGNWTFTTAAGPVATVLSPANTSTNIAANTAIQITFDKNVTAVSGKRLKIIEGTNTLVDIDVAATGTVTNAVYQFTPGSLLPTGKVLNISVDAGAFKDATTQADFNGIASTAWSFTIAPGPAIATLSPANNATSVATNTPIQITFDKNVTAVAGKKLKVMDGTTTLVDVDVAASGTVTNAVYSFTPPTAFPNNKLLKVIVDAGAFIDPTKQTDFAGIAADTWAFTTVLAPDGVGPVITFVPPLTAAKGFNNLISPEITVTDDRGTVSSVVITIKKISGATSTAVNVPAIQGTGSNVNKWVFTISESNHFDATGTEYFIIAKDPAGNQTRNPATGTHKLYLTYTANESKIPSDKLGFGGTAASWKVFAIPFEMGSNNSVTTIFNELDGKTNKVDFRFLTIQPTANTNWTEYPSFATINRGQGYFSNIKTPIDILLGPLQAPENSRSALFTIDLKAGWNMVGNPYLTQISWADVKTYNALSGQMGELHKFNGSTYPVAVQTLDAYEGGFVFSQSDKTVTIPFLGQVATGGREGYHLLGNDINDTEWILKLNVTQAGTINDLGSIGMAPDAKISLDDYDGVTPPRFIEYLETNFAHPEHFAKRFTRDVVPTQSQYTWNFTIDSNLEGEAEIFWNNSAFAYGAKQIFLFDEARQKLIDMKTVSSYSFNSKEVSKFKIYFGEDIKLSPESVVLGKAFPNPTSGNTNIAFSLPDAGGQSQVVTLDILDATGRTMGVIAQGRYTPGFHEATFNAKDFNNGFYTYRLTVQNSRGRNTIVQKLIIK